MIAEGSKKLASVPSGGSGGGAPSGGAATGGGAPAAEAKVEEKEEEKEVGAAHLSTEQNRSLTRSLSRSLTRIWVSVSSTKQSIFLEYYRLGIIKKINRNSLATERCHMGFTGYMEIIVSLITSSEYTCT